MSRWSLILALAATLALPACDDTPVEDKSKGDTSLDASASDGLGLDGGGGTDSDSAADVLVCPPKLAGCIGGERWVCNATGSALEKDPCPTGELCDGGECVQCKADADCTKGQVCLQGECKTQPLDITTASLPPALVATTYSAKLEAKGGTPPLTWSLAQGALPGGILLGEDGGLGGSATLQGSFSFQVQVKDAAGQTDAQILVLDVKEGGLVIKTPSPLKPAVDGEPYSAKLEAQGGTPPYFWGVVGGKLPPGLQVGSDGSLQGTPTGEGTFTFDVKVLDNANPTATAVKTYELPMKLAPLEITAPQVVDLFLTKLIVLPLIVVVDKVPVPYSAKLQAKGGKKPYNWAEVPLPGALKAFVPKAGIPQGLKLAADGTISGAVTDASLVFELKVPLSQIVLKGFFFAAEVSDSQGKPAKKTAIFIIPTVPVGG